MSVEIPGRRTSWANQRVARPRHLLYCVTFLSTVALLLLLPVFAMTTQAYITHSNYEYDEVIDYKASLSGNTSNIVFYGDSSLLHGVVPTDLRSNLNVNVYNLGIPANAFSAMPDFFLDRYIEHNKKPEVIVLYIGPMTVVNGFDFDTSHFYETALTLGRFSTFSDAFAFYAHSPRRIFGVAAVVLRNLLAPPEPSGAVTTSVRQTLDAEAGFVPFPPTRAANRANPRGLLAGKDQAGQRGAGIEPDAEYIRAFRRKYEATGAKVLVYLAPSPDCVNIENDVIAKYVERLCQPYQKQ